MKTFTHFPRNLERERKYPFLVALDLFLHGALCAALLICVVVDVGWIAWKVAPQWSARVAATALRVFR